METRACWLLLLVCVLLLSACGAGYGEDSSADACTPAAGAATSHRVGGLGASQNCISISGVIRAGSGTAVDADTNDPLAGNSPNNTPATSQTLPNPVVVGGFATAVATGRSSDAFGTESDPLDRYRVTLIKGQIITLFVADHPAAVFALELYDSNVPAVAVASAGTSDAVKRITVPHNGEFNVLVTAASGASNYVLTIGQSVVAQAQPVEAAQSPFVPGEIIVRLHESTLTAAPGNSMAPRAASLGMQTLAGEAGRAMLFSIADPIQRQRAFALNGLDSSRTVDQTMDNEERLKRDTVMLLEALRKRKDIQSADLNYLRQPSYAPDDELYPLQWHYPLVNLPQAWDVTSGDAGVIVAIIDTGVYVDHPDLRLALATTGYDFISNPRIAVDGDGLDTDPDDPGDSGTPGRSSFHGTHVAGTVAASSGNVTGVAGVAAGARVMPLRALGKGGGTSYDIIQALRYAAGLSNDSGIVLPRSERADIVNLSLGGSAFSQAEQDMFDELRAAGVIVIAAAGNRGSATPVYPAAYDGVVSVSAVDLNKQLAPYSSFGATVDVTAPGGDIGMDDNGDGLRDGVLSTWVDDSSGERLPAYRVFQGTSMAAPHVAGIVALMKGRYPQLTPQDLDALLAANEITSDLLPPGRDNSFGHGLIDAWRAVLAAEGLASGEELPPAIAVAPNSLNFGSNLTTATVNVRNIGGGVVSIMEVSDDAEWLTVVEARVDAARLGGYTLEVDRTNLADGVYNAEISFSTDAQASAVMRATMLVDTDGMGVTADTGFHFVTLIERVSGDRVETVSAVNIGGEYTYEFTGVAPGEYFVVAGSDFDNDGVLCEPGEACGGYPIANLLRAVKVVGANVTNVDFRTSFDVSISGAGKNIGVSGGDGNAHVF